jgi:hypothetical protein
MPAGTAAREAPARRVSKVKSAAAKSRAGREWRTDGMGISMMKTGEGGEYSRAKLKGI